MAKIMLVEDDNNLREIYQARLAAEGYEIVSAKDGEEALAIAVKEKPDLIVSDVMMPKVSGFEMLDILRSTSGIKDTKIIMMTALSQAEDKARAEKLGADRYLVKSQVTLEDMAKTVADVLNGVGENDTPAAPAPDSAPAVVAAAPAVPQTPPPTPPSSPEQLLTHAADTLSAASEPEPVRPEDKPMTEIKSISNSMPVTSPPPEPIDVESTSDGVTIAQKKVIQPLNDLSKPNNNLDELLAKEEAKEELEAAKTAQAAPVVNGEPQTTPAPITDPPTPTEFKQQNSNDNQEAPKEEEHASDPNSIAL